MAVIESCSGSFFSLNHSLDTHPVDEWFEYHIHEGYELFCLVKGKVGYVVEGHIYKLRPGAVLLMRSSEAHKLIVNESDEYERYVLDFRPELFNSFSPELLSPFTERALGERNLYLPSELGISAVSVFERIFKDYSFAGAQNCVVSSIASLLCSVLRAFSNKSASYERDQGGVAGEIISYVNARITDDISIKDVSDAVHLSTSQVSRIFKSISGTSVYDYILSKRLILFQEKRASGKSALEASQECGFRDYSSFYRLYKKKFGISPSKVNK